MEQVIVHEQFGQVTGGLWSYMPGAYNVLVHCDPEQRRRYLDPSIRGERNGQLRDHREGGRARTPGRWPPPPSWTPPRGDYVLNGEKWFVTGPDDTDFMIFHCHLVARRGAPADALPGRLRHARRAPEPRPGLHAHVRRPPSAVHPRGRPGAGRGDPGRDRPGRRADQRVVRRGADPHRGALHRGDGAAARPGRGLGHATGSSSAQRIYDFQGVSFPLADSAADAAAARLLTRECAWLADSGRRSQGRPRPGLDRQAVRVRGGLPLRRPGRPGLRRAGLHAREPRRAVLPRAPRRPDLGGHLRDPAR